MKFGLKFCHFQSRKCIWNCRLPKWRPFCREGMSSEETISFDKMLSASLQSQSKEPYDANLVWCIKSSGLTSSISNLITRLWYMLSINIYWNTNHLYVQNKDTYDIAHIYFPVSPLYLSFKKVHLFNINFVPIPAIKAGDSFNSCRINGFTGKNLNLGGVAHWSIVKWCPWSPGGNQWKLDKHSYTLVAVWCVVKQNCRRCDTGTTQNSCEAEISWRLLTFRPDIFIEEHGNYRNAHTAELRLLNNTIIKYIIFSKYKTNWLISADDVISYAILIYKIDIIWWRCDGHMKFESKIGQTKWGMAMMTSSNGNIFRVTGHLCGEFTGPGEFPAQRPVRRSFDVFFDISLNKRLSKQTRGWWFETQSRPLWRHCNGPVSQHKMIPCSDHVENYVAASILKISLRTKV